MLIYTYVIMYVYCTNVILGPVPLSDCGAAQIYGIDRDPVALKYASDLQAHLKSHQKLDVTQGSFSKMTTLLESKGVQ